MKQLLDFIPLIVFFIFYKLYDIFIASGALIAASALALIVSWAVYRKLEKQTLITFALVSIFGTLTIALHDDLFIKWKVTIVYTLFSLCLLFSQFWMKQTILQKMLSSDQLVLPEYAWRKLNLAWALFFLSCGLLNLYVAFELPQSVWVNFKVFGFTGLTLLFTLASGVYIYRLLPSEQQK